jgi:hypothetical protein
MRKRWQRTKGKVQIYWRLGRKSILLISAGLTAVTAVFLERNHLLSLSFIVAILGLLWTTWDWWRLNQQSKNYQLVKDEQGWKSLHLSSSYNGWQPYCEGSFGIAWSNPKVNRVLSESSTPIRRGLSTSRLGRMLHQPRDFKLPDSVSKFERHILLGQASDAIIFNEKKVRIDTDLSEEILRRGTVTLERTSYFDSLCTNDFTEWVLQLRGEQSIKNSLLGIDVVSSNGLLRDLSERMLSNHVGGSTLAFTSDDYLVIQRQTNNNRQSPGRAAPSGSGSFRWKDTKGASTIQDVVRAGLRRELVEETGAPKGAQVPVEILGAVRHIHRGGQVEFYGIARLPVQWSEVRAKRGELLWVFDQQSSKCRLESPVALAEDIHRIYKKLPHSGPVSFPLQVAQSMLLDVLLERPEVVGRALDVEWKTQPQEKTRF